MGLIDRDAAIDRIRGTGYADQIKENVIMILMSLPSAQPNKRTEERVETHACDCISRQAAIDAINRAVTKEAARWSVEELPSAGPKITLDDLLDLIDYNRESTTERIQICGPDDDWDDYDELRTSSSLLFHIGRAKVSEIEAVSKDVIRVGLDWSTLSKEAPHEP